MRTTINVTQELIDQSIQYRNTCPDLFNIARQYSCPIALALNKATGKVWRVNAYKAVLYDLATLEMNQQINFSNQVINFIHNFDLQSDEGLKSLAQKLVPFSCEMEIINV